MKKLFLTLLFFSLSILCLKSQIFVWDTLSHPQLGILRGIHFFDDTHGIIIENNLGYIITADGGENWNWEIIDQDNFYNDMFVLNNEIIYFSADIPDYNQQKIFGGIYKSVNKGNNWEKLEYTFEYLIDKVLFISNEEGYVLDNLKNLYKTINGGKDFEKIYAFAENGYLVNSLAYIDDKLWAITNSGIILQSSDLGVTWNELYYVPNTDLRNIREFNQKIFIVCRKGKLLISEDYGATWQIEQIGEIDFFNISFFIQNIGVIVGNSVEINVIYITFDGGKTWYEETVPKALYTDAAFLRDNKIYLVGLQYHSATVTNGILIIGNISCNVNEEKNKYLFIYPNPSSDILHIQTTALITNTVLTDILGRTVFKQNGNVEQINTAGLAPGLYLLKLYTAGGEILTEKVVVR